MSQLALNKENIRPLCLPTVKLRGTRHYYLNGVKLLSRVSLSLSLCVRVLSSVHPMHNAYSPPSACTLIDIPTIGRFAYGDIIVVSPNRLFPSLPPSPRSTTIPSFPYKTNSRIRKNGRQLEFISFGRKVNNRERERIEGDGKWEARSKEIA